MPDKQVGLKALVETNPGRVHHIALDPFWWDTYTVIKERGLLENVQKLPWEQGKPSHRITSKNRSKTLLEHSQLLLTGLVPDSINGERLIMQQLSCIPSEMWLYDYGRFTSHLLLSGSFREVIHCHCRRRYWTR